MTETQRRIRAYQRILPELRERVVAVALLLAMSTSMLSSASFAWLTLSRSPEVSAVSTTIAANGSLEVALATGNGRVVPVESKVGDSSAAKGQSVTAANITWGNLINLSDPAYGLEEMVLRPAQLNRTDLLGSPLYGAAYSNDGRITKLESDFGYTAWIEDENVGGRFMTTDQVGVRAISSMKADSSAAENKVANAFKAVKESNLKAAASYQGLANNSEYMQSLATMMGLYMTARMNSVAHLTNPDCNVDDIRNLREMYKGFLSAFDDEVQAMVQLANLTLSLKYGEENYQPMTAAQLLSSSTTSASLLKEGIQITNLAQFQKDRKTIASDLEALSLICETSATTVKWTDSGLVKVVNNLVDVGACTIGNDGKTIGSIGATDAMGYLSGTQEARITNGILYRFEERTGGYLEVKNLGITATVNRTVLGFEIEEDATVKANIQTTAPRDYYLFNNDLLYAQSQVEGGNFAVDMIAQDTYGLAVDMWVRTNAANSYLTLEGNVLSESKEVRATGKNAANETVELSTLKTTVTDENGETHTYTDDVYWGSYTVTDDNGNTSNEEGYIYLKNHTPATISEGDQVQEKLETVVTVYGYEGENRVWSDGTYGNMLSTDATTQGSGSCYVYYADTPEDQARSLKLLEAFNVAFVDSRGKLLASAIMDTEHAYAAVGRVTVPLVMNPSESITLSDDGMGNAERAITPLEQNVPTRITAIVYLDGTKLTNKEVLAAADIQGQLNIQFGTNTPLVAMEDEKLMDQTVDVIAEVTPPGFDWDTAEGPLTATVKVTVIGYEPESVTGVFLRQISATQGNREDTNITFTKQDDGTWIGTHTFTAPGNYVLRTVRLDGIDYDVGKEVTITDELGDPVLDANGNPQTKVEYPGSTVTGFTVYTLECKDANENRVINIMNAASESSVKLNLHFASSDPKKMPQTVQARFLDESGANVNVDFSYNPGSGWTGTGTFRVSGEYTLRHLVLDGEPMPLDSEFWMTAIVTLGMRASVYTDDDVRFPYQPGSVLEDGTPWNDVYKILDMSVKIMDSAGNERPGLQDVSLTYSSGSRTMYTSLEWDGKYYVGKMENGGPGIWRFSNVQIGNTNTITQTTYAPEFTIISPNPPEYFGYTEEPYQFVMGKNKGLYMNVSLLYASTADNAVATIVNLNDGKTYEVPFSNRTVEGENGEKSTYQFTLPYNQSGYQDGNWKMTGITLWGGLYNKEGTEYNEQSPWVYDMSGLNNVTKVVNEVKIEFPTGMSKNFGTNASGQKDGDFMTQYSVPAGSLSVEIKDGNNKPIDGLTNVQLRFEYKDGTTAQYGGYTNSSIKGSNVKMTLNMVQDGTNKTKYVQPDALEFLYAGAYNTYFSFDVKTADKTITVAYSSEKGDLPANAPVYTVSSVTPTVAISAISPTGTYTVDTTDDCQTPGCRDDALSFNGHTANGATASYTATTANVYFKCTIDNSRYHHYERPNVTITLANIGNGTKAVLSFGSGTHVYNGTTQTGTYEWTQDGTAVRNIGYFSDKGNSQTDIKTRAGTITANTLVVTHNGVDYNVALSPAITINNPY